MRLSNEILDNPYDHDRDDFVKVCRKHIDFFKDEDDEVLKKLYYNSKIIRAEPT